MIKKPLLKPVSRPGAVLVDSWVLDIILLHSFDNKTRSVSESIRMVLADWAKEYIKGRSKKEIQRILKSYQTPYAKSLEEVKVAHNRRKN